MKRSGWSLGWFIWWLPLLSWAEAAWQVEEGIGRYEVSSHFEYLEDKTRHWDFEDIRTPGRVAFSPNVRDTLSFGYVNSVYWLRLTVASRASRDTSWLLELTGLARSIDEIDAWLPEPGNGESGQWTFHRFRSGDAVPFSARSIKHHAILFPLSLPPAQPVTLYLRVQTNGTLQIPAVLWSTARYAEVEHHDYLQEGIFYGILLVMIFYNAFIYFSVRDKSYLHYVFYLICVQCFAVSLKGIGFEYLWPEATWWNNKSNLVFALVGVFFLLLFARSFLHTRENAQSIHSMLNVLLITSACTFPLVLFASHYVAASALSIQYLLSVLAVIAAASVTLQRGFKAARYYLLAWLGVLIAVLMWVLNSFSIINNYWIGAYSFQVGTAVQVILFSFALADRINLMRREREDALKLQLENSRQLISMANMFEKFVPRQFLSRIARKGIENIELGKAESDTISVIFADIRGFTPLSEAMNPQQLLNFLNSYFKRMDKVIHHHEGFIDKFLGDGIMAIFEAANETKGARNAVTAAIEMQHALVTYNQHRANSGYAPIDIGIGVNTGDVVIGTVGSHERMDSTVLGDNVNIAARLQELTKIFGVKIIISEQTQIGLQGDAAFLLRELGDVNVRGRKEPVRLFEVMNADPAEQQQAKLSALPTHRIALECYRRGEWAWAKMLWEDCFNRYPKDSVYRYMIEQCDLYLVNMTLNNL